MSTIAEFEKKHDVKLIAKYDSKLMSLIGFFLKSFMTDFWTTYRLPWTKPIITYPDGTKDPLSHISTLEHELIHTDDVRSFLGLLKTFLLYFFVPLPVLFSGRWYVEFPAYLNDITKYNMNVERAVDILWSSYLWCWPKPLMRKKFYKHLKEYNNAKEKRL